MSTSPPAALDGDTGPPSATHRIATNRDVAALARVSVATVSAVVNGTRYVSPETTKRVRAAIAELGYRPNRLARSLSTRTTRLVGLVVPSVLSPIMPLLFKAAEEELHAGGYSVLFANSEMSLDVEADVLGRLFDLQVDGLLLVPTTNRPQLLERFEAVTRPVVVMLNRIEQPARVDVVESGNYAGSRAAVEHLLEQGCARIATLALPPATPSERERIEAYYDALRGRGITPEDDLVRWGTHSESWSSEVFGYSETAALCALPTPPDGIFAMNQFMAVGALRALHERGVRVPDEVAIVGYDDFVWTSQLDPPLSVVAQKVEEVARLAARMLVERLTGANGSDVPPRSTRIETELIVRRSSLRRPPDA